MTTHTTHVALATLALVASTLLAPLAASASTSPITSRALAGTDSMAWNAFGSEYASVANPSSAHSAQGNLITLSGPTGNFLVLKQANSWGGGLGEGSYANSHGPLTINFASPVQDAGTQIESDSRGLFLGTITAYDASHTDLGSYSYSGVAASSYDNSDIFVGLHSDSANIASLTIGLNGDVDFAINALSFTGTAVPEPASLSLLALCGAALLGRHRKG